MHLLILGATGRTGLFAYKYALNEGHHVTALVRDTSALESHANLTLIKGSVLSEEDMNRAFTVADTPVDAVLVFLNCPRTSENPWAKFIGPPRLIADGTANATRALRKQQQQNPRTPNPIVAVLSAFGTGESRQVTPLIMRLLIDYSNVKCSYDDHNATNAEIEDGCGNDIDWTVVMPPALGDAGIKPVKTFAVTQKGAGWSITRESVAKWMVDMVSGKFGDQFKNKRVIISN